MKLQVGTALWLMSMPAFSQPAWIDLPADMTQLKPGVRSLILELSELEKSALSNATLPTSSRMLFHSPKVGATFLAQEDALASESTLTKRERCLIGLAVSIANRCPYCFSSYQPAGRELGIESHLERGVSTAKSQLTPREAFILKWSTKITKEKSKLSRQDVKAAKAVGLNDKEIFLVVFEAAQVNMKNTLALSLGYTPDESHKF